VLIHSNFLALVAGAARGRVPEANVGQPPARQEVKRTGRLPFIKKVGVRRPALRELFRPVTTPAEVRLFSELHQRHSSKSSTNWANMCHEWNQRASLSISCISGADNAIHQKSIPLLKKFEKNLVLGILHRDSLNCLHAHNAFPLQHTFTNDHSLSAPLPFNYPPYPGPTCGPTNNPFTFGPLMTHPPLSNHHPLAQASTGRTYSAKNNRGGKGVRKRCQQGCGLFKSDCKCPRK
jgi:hypothetical protein